MSYDFVNLYLSVSINKALDALIDQLNNVKYDLMKRTKLCLKDIYELAELCLSECYFCGTMKLEYQKTRNLLDSLLRLFYQKVTFRIWNTKQLQIY